MTAPLYYIIAPDLIQNEVPPQTPHILAIQIEVANCGSTETYEIATKIPLINHFCLLLNIDVALTEHKAHEIISFFFFPNYYHQSGIPQIFLNCTNVELFNKSKEVLMSVAKSQGFDFLNCDLMQLDSKDFTQMFTSDEVVKIKTKYQALLSTNDSLKAKMFIELLSLSDINNLDQVINKEEDLYKKNNPQLFFFKQQNEELKELLWQKEEILDAAKKEIEIKDSHIAILRSQSQATHIQNYYTNEYEILPLWYKRFGHLLKAVSGKRSFRSLFTDKEKKYKQ